MRLKNSGPNIFVDSSNFLCLQNRHNFLFIIKKTGTYFQFRNTVNLVAGIGFGPTTSGL